MYRLNKQAKALAAKLSKRMVTAIKRFSMIRTDDKIVVAVSGGKDSLTLLYLFTRVLKSLSFPFSFKAVHIRPDFEGCDYDPRMEQLFSLWETEYEILDVPVMARLKPGRTMNCYWCATQRRMELLRYANRHGYGTIALGHHLEDILETLFMNMAYKGEISTMMPAMEYEKYPQRVIRPLCMVKEHNIEAFSRAMGFARLTRTCIYGHTSQRLEARRALEQLASRGDYIKENLFESMCNVRFDYLPAKKKKGF